MSGFPSADDVARAIVAACRETGDDPVVVASRHCVEFGYEGENGVKRVGFSFPRARHYAYHALVLEFSDLEREVAARLVGVQKYFSSFLGLTRYQVLSRGRYDRPPKAGWFSFEALGRVRAAICAGTVAAEHEPEIVVVYCDRCERRVGSPACSADDQQVSCASWLDVQEQNEKYRRTGAVAPETPVAVAVARELAPLAAAPVTRLVDGWAGKIALRREPSAEVDDRASELMGDPPPARSALAGAEPWRPYEERAHHSGGGF